MALHMLARVAGSGLPLRRIGVCFRRRLGLADWPSDWRERRALSGRVSSRRFMGDGFRR